MYKCEIHGELENEWCDECCEIKQCDCSNIITTRFKDLVYDCLNGEKTVTIYIDHCETCGNIIGIRE